MCNHEDHWFSLRRFGTNSYWFNLNSTSPHPQYLSNTYLDTYIAQLKEESIQNILFLQEYDIYVVFTIVDSLTPFPPCKADEISSFSDNRDEYKDLELALQASFDQK